MKKKYVMRFLLFALLLLTVILVSGCACCDSCCGKDSDADTKEAEDAPQNPPPPPPDQTTCSGSDSIPCPEQSGVCKGSVRKCTCSGDSCTYTTCDQAAYGADYQAEETKCDGLDNDCDGQVDELC